MKIKNINIITPSRICLFGEHQDYLGLPIIAMAISIYSHIKGRYRKNRTDMLLINKSDFNKTETFSLNQLEYTKKRDYLKSGIKVCKNEGLKFSKSFRAEIKSNIPIQAGCSSSSSIMVGWIRFLSQIADNPIIWPAEKIAKLAYKSEVLEFSEPGGMMDQYSTALGGLIYLESNPKIYIKKLKPLSGTFILGDSFQPKNTLGILKRCKNKRLNILKKLKHKNPNLNFDNIEITDLKNNSKILNKKEKKLINATIENRNILKLGLLELNKKNPNQILIGDLLTQQHSILRDDLCISTSKIDLMLEAALNAGALGGKINGSGGGGCMFVYAPNNPEKVAESIEKVGGKTYLIETSKNDYSMKYN